MFTCKACGCVLPFGQAMVVMRANIGKFGDIETSHFEACYCCCCAQKFDGILLESRYDCCGCDSPIVEGEEIITLSLELGTLIFDDLKFIEHGRAEIYRVHSTCFDPAKSAQAISAASLPG